MFQYYAFSVFENWGFLDFLLPFILIFTLIYAILEKIGLFSTEDNNESKKINIAIAFVIGLSTVIQHVLYPTTYDPVTIINAAIPQVSMVLVAILLILILLGLFLGKSYEPGNKSKGLISLIAFALIIFIFGNAAGWWGLPNFLYFLADPDLQALIIVIVVFALLINFITGDDNSSSDKKD